MAGGGTEALGFDAVLFTTPVWSADAAEPGGVAAPFSPVAGEVLVIGDGEPGETLACAIGGGVEFLAPQYAIARKQLIAKTIPPSVPPTIQTSNEPRDAKDGSNAAEVGVSDVVVSGDAVWGDAVWGDVPPAICEPLADR